MCHDPVEMTLFSRRARRASRSAPLLGPLLGLLLGLLLGALSSSPAAAEDAAPRRARLIERAREEVLREVRYDRRYVERGQGEPAWDRGACTDLVVRAARAAGVDIQIDLQKDALAHPEAYPAMARRDGRVDHRRTPNLLVWLGRTRRGLPTGLPAHVDGFLPGDIVVWTYGKCPECKADHVGIVSDRQGTRGYPLVIHNAGPRATEEDALDAWPVMGHYRLVE